MDVANLQRKISYSVFLRQKILQVRNWQSNQSWLKDSRHQSLIANWLINARRFCIITIWCEVKMRWNERGVKWMWGEMNVGWMNVGWNERGVKWMWGEMIWGEEIWGEMILGWNERTPKMELSLRNQIFNYEDAAKLRKMSKRLRQSFHYHF